MKFIPCSSESQSDRLLYKAQDESIHKYERLLTDNSDILNFAESKSKTVIHLFSLSNPIVQVKLRVLRKCGSLFLVQH